jgi:hypothetical protein
MVREVTDEAERLRTEVELEVARRRQDSITDAEAEINMAKQQGREMVNEARAYREKVLGELARRREAARQQIEQLVHGRERLVQAFERARLAANDVLGELVPLIEPDEFVNLSPITGPVPLMVPNSPPPTEQRTPETQGPADAEPTGAGVVSSAAVEQPQVYDVEHEADDEQSADVLTAAAAAVADSAAAESEAATAVDARVVESEVVESEVVESEVIEPEVVEPEVVEGTAIESSPVVADTPVVSEQVAQHEPVDHDHDDRPIAPVVSIFGSAGEATRVREPEAPLPPAAPTPPKHSVDDLFARLRASRTDAVAAKVEAPAADAAAPAPTAVAPTTTEAAPAKATKPRTKVVTEKIAGAKVVERVPVDEPEAAAAPAAKKARAKATPAVDRPSVFERTETAPDDTPSAAEIGPDLDDDSPFARREAVLAPVIAAASRKVKRVLADEQNDLLQLLRRKEPVRALDALLPRGDEHIARTLEAVADDLLDAALAGAASLDKGSKAAHKKALLAVDATRVAREHLANVLVDPLRERLDREIADAAGVNADIANAVRALYREWKNHRIDSAVDDAIRQAFGSGALASVPAGTKLVWAVDPDGPASPDCDDNALAGAVAAGDPFPTDHLCAPAHPGCRCMLLRAPR